uniref:Uncharacterized protein n=1 Tax=Trichogramma kaykai TaxID=54128 RepID=A0ABD2WZD9_9HYME
MAVRIRLNSFIATLYIHRSSLTCIYKHSDCTYACIEMRVEVGPHKGSTSASLGIVGRVRKSLPPYRLCVNQRSAKDCLLPRTICVAAPRDTFATSRQLSKLLKSVCSPTRFAAHSSGSLVVAARWSPPTCVYVQNYENSPCAA